MEKVTNTNTFLMSLEWKDNIYSGVLYDQPGFHIFEIKT